MSIKLFGSYTSPFVRHCRIAFAETGIDYQFVEADYDDSASSSPTQRVPYLHDEANDIKLHDSMAILQYLREQMDQPFLPNVLQTEQFALANTVCDTAINLFLLEKDGVSAAENAYLQRQQARIESSLQALDGLFGTPKHSDAISDADWRVACVLDWGVYRNRFSLEKFTNLQTWLKSLYAIDVFSDTAPPK